MTRIDADLASELEDLHTPLVTADDLQGLIETARGRRFIAIGEASHGTHEFYEWRAELTRRLIAEGDVAWIGVEGDWPDCWRIDRWVRGLADAPDARAVLSGFSRWPTWMWANTEVCDFLDWLREHNRALPPEQRTGFYGLDVYSLWDSLARVIGWLHSNSPSDLPTAMKAWECFAPFNERPENYAWNTRLVPETCEADVVSLLATVRRRSILDGDEAFDALQNATIAANAENYYRAMVRTDAGSWNIRDTHMVDTIDRLAAHFGPASKGIIWAHNTHIGDARGTSMHAHGLINLGQLLRERHGLQSTLLVGFASHRGSVLAASRWGSPPLQMPVPDAAAGSHEDTLHRCLAAPAILDFPLSRVSSWLSSTAGHRAIGVVYEPRTEAQNYVPTTMGMRYDALIWLEDTTPVTPITHERTPAELEFETEPSGY